MPLHPAAAEGFDRDVAAYERGRPSYPPGAVAAVAASSGPGPVVELGAGPGTFTRLLAPHVERLVAVEPVAAMRARLTASLRSGDLPPRTAVIAGTAEALPLATGCTELVVAAQAFHWFATTAALAELHRVLRPGGHLTLVWNEWLEQAEWELAFRAVRDRHRGDAPQYRTGRWRDAFAGPAARWFEPLVHLRLHNEQVVSPAGAVDRVASVSYVAALPPAEHARVRDELWSLLPTADPDARYTLTYRTDVYTARRR